MSEDFSGLRKKMVETQLKGRGLSDKRVLEAMGKIPRHLFVPETIREEAYDDRPLPIGFEQTISQPYIVALMAEAGSVLPTDKVLEIGSGSGYSAAILASLAAEVHTVERIEPLAKRAKEHLKEIKNAFVYTSDGSLGLKEKAPFDVIVVTAAAPKVPESLLEELSPKGRLIIPVGDKMTQRLLRYTKQADGTFKSELLEHVRFVPLIGKKGFF